MFTLRGTSPLGHGSDRMSPTRWQHDTPALPNRVAAGPSDLKAVRRREHGNVIGKRCVGAAVHGRSFKTSKSTFLINIYLHLKWSLVKQENVEAY